MIALRRIAFPTVRLRRHEGRLICCALLLVQRSNSVSAGDKSRPSTLRSQRLSAPASSRCHREYRGDGGRTGHGGTSGGVTALPPPRAGPRAAHRGPITSPAVTAIGV